MKNIHFHDSPAAIQGSLHCCFSVLLLLLCMATYPSRLIDTDLLLLFEFLPLLCLAQHAITCQERLMICNAPCFVGQAYVVMLLRLMSSV
jgi:hypothetical protein